MLKIARRDSSQGGDGRGAETTGRGPGYAATMSSRPAPPPASRRPRSRIAAAALCLVQALVLAGFAVFYVIEFLSGAGADRTQVLMSSVLILLAAAALFWLGLLWLGASTWTSTPTIVWNALLVPVAVGLLQSGQSVVGVALFMVAAVSVIAAVAGTSRSQAEPP